jgi:hypothetical protein
MTLPDDERCIFIKHDGTRCTRGRIGDSMKDTSFGGGIESCEWHYPQYRKQQRENAKWRNAAQKPNLDTNAEEADNTAATASSTHQPRKSAVRRLEAHDPRSTDDDLSKTGQRRYQRPKRHRRLTRSEYRDKFIRPGLDILEMQYLLAAMLFIKFENN